VRGAGPRLLAGCPGLRILATSREALGVKGRADLAGPAPGSPDADAARRRDRGSVEAVRSSWTGRGTRLPELRVTDENAYRGGGDLPSPGRHPAGAGAGRGAGQGASPWPRSATAWTTRSGSWPAAAGPPFPATAPCGRPSTGATTCCPTQPAGPLPPLAVFRGGFTLDAAEAVCAGRPSSSGPARSWMKWPGWWTARSSGSARRAARPATRLLETVRQYAERLADRGKRHGARPARGLRGWPWFARGSRTSHDHAGASRSTDCCPRWTTSGRPCTGPASTTRETHVRLVGRAVVVLVLHPPLARGGPLDPRRAHGAGGRWSRAGSGPPSCSRRAPWPRCRPRPTPPCRSWRRRPPWRRPAGTRAGGLRPELPGHGPTSSRGARRDGRPASGPRPGSGPTATITASGSRSSCWASRPSRGATWPTRSAHEEAVAVARRFGEDRELVIALQNLALLHVMPATWRRAEPLLMESFAASRRDPSYIFVATSLDYAGRGPDPTGSRPGSRPVLGAAEAIRERIGARQYLMGAPSSPCWPRSAPVPPAAVRQELGRRAASSPYRASWTRFWSAPTRRPPRRRPRQTPAASNPGRQRMGRGHPGRLPDAPTPDGSNRGRRPPTAGPTSASRRWARSVSSSGAGFWRKAPGATPSPGSSWSTWPSIPPVGAATRSVAPSGPAPARPRPRTASTSAVHHLRKTLGEAAWVVTGRRSLPYGAGRPRRPGRGPVRTGGPARPGRGGRRPGAAPPRPRPLRRGLPGRRSGRALARGASRPLLLRLWADVSLRLAHVLERAGDTRRPRPCSTRWPCGRS
jgi:hypothetical protein